MAGSNGIVKYMQVNREDEALDLKWRGTEYRQFNVADAITSAQLTAANLLEDLLFDATTPNALTTPTMEEIFRFLSSNYLTEPGSGWKQIISNTDPVNDKVITFPAGWTPATVTIPAGQTVEFAWTVTSQNPPMVELVSQVNSSSYFFSTTPAQLHDGLTFNGSVFSPTSANNNMLYTDFHGLHSFNSIGIGGGGGYANVFESQIGDQPGTLYVTKTGQATDTNDQFVEHLEGLDPFGSIANVTQVVQYTELPTTAVEPATPANTTTLSDGAYHIACQSNAPGLGHVFYVSRGGRVRCNMRSIPGFTAIGRDPINGELVIQASTDNTKANIQVVNDVEFLRHLPNATSWEAADFNLGRKFCSEMVSDIYNSNQLTADQKKFLLEYKYLSPGNPNDPGYDPLEMCDQAQFPTGKFDFTRPIGVQNNSFINILKSFTLKHIADLEARVTALENP